MLIVVFLLFFCYFFFRQLSGTLAVNGAGEGEVASERVGEGRAFHGRRWSDGRATFNLPVIPSLGLSVILLNSSSANEITSLIFLFFLLEEGN